MLCHEINQKKKIICNTITDLDKYRCKLSICVVISKKNRKLLFLEHLEVNQAHISPYFPTYSHILLEMKKAPCFWPLSKNKIQSCARNETNGTFFRVLFSTLKKSMFRFVPTPTLEFICRQRVNFWGGGSCTSMRYYGEISENVKFRSRMRACMLRSGQF